MTMNDYQKAMNETRVYPSQGKFDGLTYAVFGLVGEAGEVAQKLKKLIRDENSQVTDEFRKALIAELGDCLWYITAIATELNYNLAEVAALNIAKLYTRKQAGTIKGSGDER